MSSGLPDQKHLTVFSHPPPNGYTIVSQRQSILLSIPKVLLSALAAGTWPCLLFDCYCIAIQPPSINRGVWLLVTGPRFEFRSAISLYLFPFLLQATYTRAI